MAFGVPKAWSPGLALPQYVRDEGLERHAFTTLQVPDGTYDNPAVGDGGYVVPQYVLQEGYGQGAAITKWAPRGSYFGPKVPYWLNQPGNTIINEKPVAGGGTQFTLQPLGDTDDAIHPAYQQYGNRAAATLLAHVQRAPANARKATLRRALDSIDPSLWRRTQTIADQYVRQGVPPQRALHAGLSRAMAAGMLAEVIQTGRTGKRPKARGQLGLGCYGRSAIMGALGDAAAPRARHTRSAARMALGSLGDIASTAQLTASQAIPGKTAGPLQEGSCSTDGFIFKNGTWARKSAADVCTDYVATTAQSGGPTGGGVTVTTTQPGAPGDFKGPFPLTYDFSSGDASSSAPNAASQQLKVGPFTIPMNAKQYTIHWSGLMPADWITFITAELAHDCSNCVISSMEDATPGHTMGVLRDFFGANLPSKVNKDLVTVVSPQMNTVTNKPYVKVGLPDQPIAMVSRPDNGEVWGMFMVVSPKDPTYPWDSTTNPYELQFWWRKKPSGVWDWIKRIVGAIIDIVGDALSAIGGLACGLLTSSGGKAGAVVGGAAVGGAAGAQAGAAGANIAAGACGGPAPLMQQQSDLLPLVILGGAAVVAMMVVTSKPRKKKVEPHK